MEEILREAFKQGQQWGIDATEGKAPIGFTEWFKSAETKALILHVVSQQRELLLAYERHCRKATNTKEQEGDKLLIEDFLANNCG